jgi:hypothetical protein
LYGEEPLSLCILQILPKMLIYFSAIMLITFACNQGTSLQDSNSTLSYHSSLETRPQLIHHSTLNPLFSPPLASSTLPEVYYGYNIIYTSEKGRSLQNQSFLLVPIEHCNGLILTCSVKDIFISLFLNSDNSLFSSYRGILINNDHQGWRNEAGPSSPFHHPSISVLTLEDKSALLPSGLIDANVQFKMSDGKIFSSQWRFSITTFDIRMSMENQQYNRTKFHSFYHLRKPLKSFKCSLPNFHNTGHKNAITPYFSIRNPIVYDSSISWEIVAYGINIKADKDEILSKISINEQTYLYSYPKSLNMDCATNAVIGFEGEFFTYFISASSTTRANDNNYESEELPNSNTDPSELFKTYHYIEQLPPFELLNSFHRENSSFESGQLRYFSDSWTSHNVNYEETNDRITSYKQVFKMLNQISKNVNELSTLNEETLFKTTRRKTENKPHNDKAHICLYFSDQLDGMKQKLLSIISYLSAEDFFWTFYISNDLHKNTNKNASSSKFQTLLKSLRSRVINDEKRSKIIHVTEGFKVFVLDPPEMKERPEDCGQSYAEGSTSVPRPWWVKNKYFESFGNNTAPCALHQNLNCGDLSKNHLESLTLLEFAYLKQINNEANFPSDSYLSLCNLSFDESVVMSTIDINIAMEYATLRLDLSFITYLKSHRAINKYDILNSLQPPWVKRLWKTTVEEFEEKNNYAFCDVFVLGNERTSMSSLLTGTAKLLGITRYSAINNVHSIPIHILYLKLFNLQCDGASKFISSLQCSA